MGGYVLPRRGLIASQTRPCLPWQGTVGRFFWTDCCYILISLHRVRLPLRRKYQLPGQKEPRKLSSVGRRLTGANPRPPTWSDYTHHCLGCWSRCEQWGRVKSMPFRSPPTLARKISSRLVEGDMLIRNRNFV